MKKIILSIGLVLPTLLWGQLDRSIQPQAKAAPSINIKDSEVFKTSNGITVILSENHKLPRVSFNLVMGSDPKVEGDKAGLSELTGSLIMSGTSNRSKDQLDGEIDYIGASLSADENSLFLSCLTKHMDKGLTLMSDVLTNANFPQSEVDRIIAQNESGLLSAKSDPGTMARNAEAVANFPKGHPYGELMTESTLKNINRDAIVAYFNETFTPDGSYLVIVGDIDKTKASEMAKKYFANWKGGKAFKQEWGPGQFHKGNRVIFVKKPGAVQSVINVSFPVNITPKHEDYLKLRVLNGILGGGAFGSRLMQNLREDKAYTYGCRSRVTITEDGSWFSAGGNFRNEVSDSAITEILRELEGITDDYVTDEELSLTKSSMAGGFARSLERPSTIARFALSIIKNDLAKDYYQTYLKKLEAITKEDILLTAQKYFNAKQCNIVVVGNEEILDRLVVFDSDGEIEKLDAFGNPVKEVIPSDLSADELIGKYVNAVTKTSGGKALAKMMKKIKSMEEVTELTMPQMPFPMKSTRVWVAPGTTAQKMEAQGMVMQKSFFDGDAGHTFNMQTGKEELTAEEIAAKKKSVGLIPEMNYATSGMNYEVLGIERKNGVDCYVLKTEDGDAVGYDYFDKSTFLKIASMSIETDGEETQEISISYGDYEETDGILFPKSYTLSVGQANLSAKVISRTFNGKIDLNSFQ